PPLVPQLERSAPNAEESNLSRVAASDSCGHQKQDLLEEKCGKPRRKLIAQDSRLAIERRDSPSQAEEVSQSSGTSWGTRSDPGAHELT
ncbi:hypothetical protein B0H17DRAFT_1022319, partial [Mycena rosella]